MGRFGIFFVAKLNGRVFVGGKHVSSEINKGINGLDGIASILSKDFDSSLQISKNQQQKKNQKSPEIKRNLNQNIKLFLS